MSQSVKKAIKYAKPSAKLLNSRLKQEQDIRTERNKLALASVKDIFSIFNPNAGSDEDFDLTDFDSKVYFANPKAFEKLPFFKQQYVIEEMNEKLKKNWKSLDKDIKRFSIWWAYGSHGPREGFVELHDYYTPYGIEAEELTNNVNQNEKELKDNEKSNNNTELNEIINKISNETTNESSASSKSALQMSNNAKDSLQINNRPDVPPDLPFKLPSILKTFKPDKNTNIIKLPTLDSRSFGLKRLQQYKQDRRMNPVNRIVLVFLVFLTVLCFKQDRRVNVTGVVPEYPWVVAEREEKEEEERKKNEELKEANRLAMEIKENEIKLQKKSRKWYYLWLF
jgi:hypothetical protein